MGYLGLPAAEWWEDIEFTCSNTIFLFGTPEHVQMWRRGHPGEQGAELSVDLMLRLREASYAGKLERRYARPSCEHVIQPFQDPQLTGEFWKI